MLKIVQCLIGLFCLISIKTECCESQDIAEQPVHCMMLTDRSIEITTFTGEQWKALFFYQKSVEKNESWQNDLSPEQKDICLYMAKLNITKN